jgi:hypothetical protein
MKTFGSGPLSFIKKTDDEKNKLKKMYEDRDKNN